VSSEQPNPELEQAAGWCEEAAVELDRAAAHCRVAADHFRNRLIPRAAAHLWAAFGHVEIAGERMRDQARTHSLKSRLPDD
jgi:hypothetical protein